MSGFSQLDEVGKDVESWSTHTKKTEQPVLALEKLYLVIQNISTLNGTETVIRQQISKMKLITTAKLNACGDIWLQKYGYRLELDILSPQDNISEKASLFC